MLKFFEFFFKTHLANIASGNYIDIVQNRKGEGFNAKRKT